MEDALFTTPAVPAFAGAGLINDQGELVGIGSLFVRRPFADQLVPANMFVPIEALQPILSELIERGQVSRLDKEAADKSKDDSDDEKESLPKGVTKG